MLRICPPLSSKFQILGAWPARASLPANTTVYVGRVAPIYQGIFRREAKPSLYPGMASQYLILNTRDPNIVWDAFQATGT